jgi:hypothetical protein
VRGAAILGIGLARFVAVALAMLVLAFVAVRIFYGTEAGRQDECLDRGGKWFEGEGRCVHQEDHPAYVACQRHGWEWDFEHSRCLLRPPD